MCLAAGSARAGTYSSVAYSNSGTSWSEDDLFQGNSNPPVHQGGAWPAGANGKSAGGQYSIDAQAAGSVTATFTWQPQSGWTDPPPGTVIVYETASASYSGGGGSGSASDVLGGGTTDYKWFAQSGSSTITLTDSLNASTTTVPGPPYQKASATASVSFSAAVYPVTISLAGAKQDQSTGAWKILIGQKCTASLNIPPGCSVQDGSYSWTIPPATIQAWSQTTPKIGNNPANPQASYELDGTTPTNQPTVTWFWSDHAGPKTISCTATIKPPAGQGAPFSITVTQPVTLYEPSLGVGEKGGVGRINSSGTAGPGLELYAGLPTAGFPDVGSSWLGQITDPDIFKGGQWAFLQIITPSAYSGTLMLDANSGQTGLDSAFPYKSTYSADGSNNIDGDSPGIQLFDSYASVTINDSFHLYIMYLPPDGGDGANWVPLGDLSWSFSANDQRPGTGHWTDYTPADAAGTVSPAQVTFARQINFPNWTKINANGTNK